VGGRDITIIRMYFQNVAQKIEKNCILAKSASFAWIIFDVFILEDNENKPVNV